MFEYIHIIAGTVALIAGTVAFASKKGAYYHKKAGLLFVLSMLLMAATGAVLAIFNDERLNAIAGAFTFYLVVTGFSAIRTPPKIGRAFNITCLVYATSLGIFGIYSGMLLVENGASKIDGQPIQVLFVFSGVALFAAFLDLINIAKRLNGKQRLMRHIWRMGLAMFIAVTSLFLGQAQVFPEVMRTIAVLVTPVLLVVILTIFWLLKVQFWGLGKRK